MRQVTIINGTYGHKPEGAKYVTPAKAGTLLTLSDEEAARLVSIGVAEYAAQPHEEVPAAPVATPPVGDDGGEAGETSPDIGSGAEGDDSGEGEDVHGDGGATIPAYSVDMKVDQLRALLEQFGIQFKVGMTKADMVAALDELFAGDPEDGETPPVTGAEEPLT